MPLYRKKSVLREAEQFRGFYATPYPPGLQLEDNSFYVVTTNGQKVYVEPGDYVVREPDGNGYYPCKAAIFEAEYDPVGE